VCKRERENGNEGERGAYRAIMTFESTTDEALITSNESRGER